MEIDTLRAHNYLSSIAVLHNLPESYGSLMRELLKEVNLKRVVNINASIKKQIATALNYKNKQSVDNGISKLVEQGLMRRLDRGIYAFNPDLFGIDWNDIYRGYYEIIVRYNENGNREISTNFNKRK